jgi:hypothetical protein
MLSGRPKRRSSGGSTRSAPWRSRTREARLFR